MVKGILDAHEEKAESEKLKEESAVEAGQAKTKDACRRQVSSSFILHPSALDPQRRRPGRFQ
jgi:hypothetical protein